MSFDDTVSFSDTLRDVYERSGYSLVDVPVDQWTIEQCSFVSKLPSSAPSGSGKLRDFMRQVGTRRQRKERPPGVPNRTDCSTLAGDAPDSGIPWQPRLSVADSRAVPSPSLILGQRPGA